MCGCDKKRCLITVIVVAAVYFGLDMLVWHVILGDQLLQNTHLWRPMPDIQSKMWVAYLGYMFFAWIFTCIYQLGYECGKCPKMQGIRYGLCVGLLLWLAGSMIQYPFFNMTNHLYLGMTLCGIVEFMILGFVVGLLHKCADKGEHACDSGAGCCS
jgi:hypothetical protein